ncbi:MAG: hypothetical protein EWV64_01575 [Microcystis flos-aquae Ma_QC_C_20070823_S18]|uniref:Uncharacterized protein n=1 Tax=Microcystis flos-aquae Mf_QC_C_20070823_S10D TaxID=2486236 RepID=A0A552KV91_9CHRO|nr:MAG: hypothetical protein EWV64_01575 [Microcystis flos-aquae Ma_QC_C_20070823_S18]TRT91112.1 MAG: hypothetical protein EWV65_22755 [Microcystis flos-aquae Ma_QC_C_20070823_S18D]TRV11890.1 MAG: hypothetical protein EWV45_10730 [Microcystis flos-aquae Mf_QC_C_20070823_S10D]TRV24592.1 MAG: hypothetical protein EWV72_11245 [Microcystis flos-aquae Mf_QC_C_20070823_S10]TRV30639.1 MAG: hypothetical protein EWV70_18770 [Microcystis flos-aquae Mf_QC_C_20070823_S20]TRV34858.1 MAG: hypothetical prote
MLELSFMGILLYLGFAEKVFRGCRVWGVGCRVWGGHCVRVAGGFGVLVETSPFPHFPISPFPYPLIPVSRLTRFANPVVYRGYSKGLFSPLIPRGCLPPLLSLYPS